MSDRQVIRVLLVEDDEEDYFITRDLLSEVKTPRFVVEWKRTFDDGLAAMQNNQGDVCLIDYRLGSHDGLELLKAAKAAGAEAPIILLTGQRQEEVDHAAMMAGAADFLLKGQVNAHHLERAIRYALERKRSASLAAFEQARLAAFGTQVGLELTRRASLETQLENCARAMTQYLNCALAQIWTYDSETKAFVPCAHAGDNVDLALRSLDFPYLSQGNPVFFASLDGESPFPHRPNLKEKGFVSFAAYPLLLEDRPVGCISLFTREPLVETVLQEIGSVANGVALCIQRKQEEALVQKLASFPRVNPNPVLEFSADGLLAYANDAASELVRSLGKKQILDLLPADVPGLVAECLADSSKKLRKEIAIGEHTLTWSFFQVADRRVVHCYGNDITERLRLEAQYRHAQKLESVGQLAAGIAHDFNNLLTVIQGYSELLQQQASAQPAMSTPLKQISSAARRATSLTRQLLTFSRKQVIQTRVINLNDVIKELANMLPRLIGEDITLQTEYGPELPAIRADTGMIEQILMNLAVNARDAMPKGGQLVVSTQALDINSNYSRQRPEARPGRFVCLTVRDTGCGMDAKTLARVFEPFFSTKEVGKGTGLGLATVYGIVKQHQGWVEVSSEVNVGTIFRIFFPASICEADKQSESGEATEFVHGGRETILLVEDEAPLREMVTRVLRGYNYRVLEATNGPEALKIWNEHSEDIDLLLTDMVMPGGLTGSDLARIVRERKPNLKVIFSSGFSAETVAPDFNEHSEFLAKPYRPNVLAQRVRKCLDAPARLNGVLAHA